jgi:hypothetical protein
VVNPADAAIEPSAAFSFAFIRLTPRFPQRRMDQFCRFDNFARPYRHLHRVPLKREGSHA